MVWIQQFMRERGRPEPVSTSLIHSVDEAVKGAASGRLDAFVLLPTEFLVARARTPLVPLLIPLGNNRPGYEYVLLSRTGVDLDSLRQTDLLVASMHTRQLPILWLDGVLREHTPSSTHEWFKEIRQVHKVSGAILPVLFGDAGACLVTLSAFETMAELNPQVGRSLQVLATSQLFSPSVICVRPDVYDEFGTILDDAMRTMHKGAAGQQVLSLFGVDRLVPFRDEYLDPVIRLQQASGEAPAN